MAVGVFFFKIAVLRVSARMGDSDVYNFPDSFLIIISRECISSYSCVVTK